MKNLTVRQMRSALTRLDEIIEKEGEIQITRRGQPIARLLPVRAKRPMPSHADLRASMPFQKIPSEYYVRKDRDGE